MVKEGRKDRALLLLKVKKLKLEQANKADAQLLSVYQLMDTIDWETQQMKVYYALKEGNQALTRLHEEMPLEKVEELMADTAENIAMEEEISKAIGGSSWSQASERDLLAELAAIEEENQASLPESQAAAVYPKPDRKARPVAPAAAAAAAPVAPEAKAPEADVAEADVAEADAAEAGAAEADVAEADVAEADAAEADAAEAGAAEADAAEANRLEELLPEAPTKTPSAFEDEEVVESTTPALVPA
ncbi:unnamed protein product [Ascophyllum nodosum]